MSFAQVPPHVAMTAAIPDTNAAALEPTGVKYAGDAVLSAAFRNAWVGAIPWTRPLRRVLTATGHGALSPVEKHHITAVASGALRTAAVIHERGYAAKAECVYCGALGTPFHRMWVCEHGKEAWEAHAPRQTVLDAKRQVPGRPQRLRL